MIPQPDLSHGAALPPTEKGAFRIDALASCLLCRLCLPLTGEKLRIREGTCPPTPLSSSWLCGRTSYFFMLFRNASFYLFSIIIAISRSSGRQSLLFIKTTGISRVTPMTQALQRGHITDKKTGPQVLGQLYLCAYPQAISAHSPTCAGACSRTCIHRGVCLQRHMPAADVGSCTDVHTCRHHALHLVLSATRRPSASHCAQCAHVNGDAQ